MSSQILGYSASNALAGDVNSLNGLKNEATNKTPQAAREAAKQLESLFMREMIKSMRQATMKSGLIDQEGGGGDLARDMYDQQLSVSMAGLPGGLSASITAQIARSMGVDEKEALAGLQQPIGGVERGGFSIPSTVNFASRSGRFTQWARKRGHAGHGGQRPGAGCLRPLAQRAREFCQRPPGRRPARGPRKRHPGALHDWPGRA